MIEKAVYYNENKVREGVAVCIAENNFLKRYDQLSLRDKLQRFNLLTELNPGVKKHTLHISLNFHPSEKFTHDELRDIARDYMEGIGFGSQPYLVYEHNDSGHPHVHVVTSSIRDDGTSINFHNIGRKESSIARKAIEKKYQLIEAERQLKEERDAVRPLNVEKLQYGKTQTKNGIARVLAGVLDKFSYGSLSELNALLSLYNVKADPGETGGRINRNRGLIYRMIKESGAHIGKPIKASSLPKKQTLSFLEERFEKNARKSPRDIKRVKGAIDWAMVSSPKSLAQLSELLKEMQVRMVQWRNDQGFVYGLTFVDMFNKAVLNGSDIDKEYSAKKILEKCGLDQHEQPLPGKGLSPHPGALQAGEEQGHEAGLEFTTDERREQQAKDSLLDILLDLGQKQKRLPWELRHDKKNGKNKSQNR